MDVTASFVRFDREEWVRISLRVWDLGLKGGDWGSRSGGRHCRCG